MRDEFVEARFEGQDTGRSARLAEVLATAKMDSTTLPAMREMRSRLRNRQRVSSTC
ncbi:hypothetical protein [Rothia mucilaginosa]|uniref:hypothetical protein n=1 Tax=Rothia mucilaginosa TaxID=43675 RepID=UPI0028D1EF1A|nr:hypothetical protein [Rothia mucilaginosa]